jgi:phage tail-like protein
MASFGGSFNVEVDVEASASASVDVGASVDFSFAAGVGAGSQGMTLGARKDPLPDYNFAVEIEGLVAGGFSEVSGLEVELELQDYREGGVNGFIHKRAGPAKYASNLVLKRGITDVKILWNWYWDVVQGTVDRKNVSILLMDDSGEEKRRWNFAGAYPVKWTGPSLNAKNNEVAIEALELVHNGLMNVT